MAHVKEESEEVIVIVFKLLDRFIEASVALDLSYLLRLHLRRNRQTLFIHSSHCGALLNNPYCYCQTESYVEVGDAVELVWVDLLVLISGAMVVALRCQSLLDGITQRCHIALYQNIIISMIDLHGQEEEGN